MNLEIGLLFVICLLLCVLLVVLLFRTGSAREESLGMRFGKMLGDAEDRLTDRVSERVSDIRRDIDNRLRHDADENRRNRIELTDMLQKNGEQQSRAISGLSESQTQNMERISDRLNRSLAEMQREQMANLSAYREKTDATLKTALTELQASNEKKLTDIQGEINQKLDVSLNERLDASFRNVGEELNRLYTSLSELGKLELGVSSLNRTLSNVKTRGVFGETQLENILSNILSASLYDRNVVTRKAEGNREQVEFAVKIPDKEAPGQFMYLPMDSKFPTAAYEKILDAAELGDADAMQKAVKELEQRVRTDARDISGKYLDPPNTTDFAIMFLPTESLYAEVLRIPGLAEECQNRYHVVITGPSTVAALLNSLSIGFRYMAVNRDSQNILKLLSAIKSQYGTLSSLIETAGNRLEMARKATADLRHRTDMINKKLSAVDEIDPIEAKSLLGLGSIKDEETQGAEE